MTWFYTLPSRNLQKLIEKLEQRCEICSKLTVKTPKQRQWCRFGVFIVNFEHILHLSSSVSIVNFEYVIAGWVVMIIKKMPYVDKSIKIMLLNVIWRYSVKFQSMKPKC